MNQFLILCINLNFIIMKNGLKTISSTFVLFVFSCCFFIGRNKSTSEFHCKWKGHGYFRGASYRCKCI